MRNYKSIQCLFPYTDIYLSDLMIWQDQRACQSLELRLLESEIDRKLREMPVRCQVADARVALWSGNSSLGSATAVMLQLFRAVSCRVPQRPAGCDEVWLTASRRAAVCNPCCCTKCPWRR